MTKHNSYTHMCHFKDNEKVENIATVLWVTVLKNIFIKNYKYSFL